MKNIVYKLSLVVILASTLFASGWRIPEQSAHSVSLAGAYVANVSDAETSYYNPANMSFNSDIHQTSLSLNSIYLSKIDYTDNRGSSQNGSSEEEIFVIPTIFYSSKDYDGIRYGLSVTAPGGLSKRWENTYQKKFAEEFSLKIIELNPVISYAINSDLSIAAGLRTLYSSGVVKSEGVFSGFNVRRDMKGDAIEYGYNLALAYKPTQDSNFSVTYRSKIDINEEGEADLYINGTKSYSGGASVKIPLPASLNIAYAHKFNNTTIEFVYDKTYWSAYQNLDFEYNSTVTNALLKTLFDNPSAKNWKDTVAKRVGITHEYNEKLKFMIGYSRDESPAPNSSLSFELPDSDASIYSVGYEYKLDDSSSYAIGYLYNQKDDRTTLNSIVDGTTSNAQAHILSFSYSKSF